MREMKDSGIEWIGEIPKNWEMIRNKNVFLCKKVLVKNNSLKVQLLSLTTKGIQTKDVNNNEGKLPETFDSYQYVEMNNIVICLFDLDISAVFSGISLYNGMISPAYKVLICKDNIVPKFADYWFKYIFIGRKFKHYAKSIRFTLTYEDFSALPIIYPTIKIQYNIANYLDDKCSKIDTIIEKQQTIIKKLKEYKISLITEMVTKGLNPNVEMKDSGIEFIHNIPKHWKILKFGKCAIIKSNLVKPNDYLDYPQISPDSIEKNSGNIINYKTVKEAGVISGNHLFFKGQIIYSKIRPTLNKVTTAPFNGLCSADMYPIETKNNVQFILFMMLSNYFTYQVKRITEDRVKMPKINQKELNSIITIIPPIEEQNYIAEYLSKKIKNIDMLIQKKQAIIDKLAEYKKSLIYEVVTGKKEI